MNTFSESPQIKWGLKKFPDAFTSIKFIEKAIKFPGRISEQGYHVAIDNKELTITAPNPRAALYALVDITERMRHLEKLPSAWQDAPMLKYRGYTVGLQQPTGYYDGHKYYDWPITSKHFPWFFDKGHMTHLLDRLASQRCNLLNLWSAHPFASLLKLKDYPEMIEVDEDQILKNAQQLNWLEEETEKRGMQLFVHFYNIHMPAPLAKAKGWDPLSGVAQGEIADYTRTALCSFVKRFAKTGLMVCMGEVLQKKDQETWLFDVIFKGILEGTSHPPPLILRAHTLELTKLLEKAKQRYPNLHTMMKHNSENLISTRPDPDNYKLAKQSPCHLINIHLCSNLEPFTWGSPQFIQKTVEQIHKEKASGIHVYPLRFWDWPNSSHKDPAGRQLEEHFLWWSAWGRYGWNPYRDKSQETLYWEKELKSHFRISEKEAKTLLIALEETATTLPTIASQFMISSGNRQNFSLGQFLVPLAFTRAHYQEGSGYSMSQLIGYPLIGEKMWSASPVTRMKEEEKKCKSALKKLRSLRSNSKIINLLQSEVEILLLLTEYYTAKALACSHFFQILYQIKGSSEEKALAYLEKSLNLYKDITKKTDPLFKDAGSIKVHRALPLPVENGYFHWKDCLPRYEEEYQMAKTGGINTLLTKTMEFLLL